MGKKLFISVHFFPQIKLLLFYTLPKIFGENSFRYVKSPVFNGKKFNIFNQNIYINFGVNLVYFISLNDEKILPLDLFK